MSLPPHMFGLLMQSQFGQRDQILLQSNVLAVQDKALRLRQHINPLKRQHQVPIDPPDWHSVYGKCKTAAGFWTSAVQEDVIC